jgi:hypothetical protein
MLSLIKATYRDAASAGWEPAKYAFGVVLSKIEDGEFSWADSLEIAEERRTSGEVTTKVCVFHNSGTCVHKGDHKSASTYWKHVCRKCWSAEHVAKECGGF